MKYELIVIWYTGEKNIYTYASKEEATKGKDNMLKVFGNQIVYSGIDKRR